MTESACERCGATFACGAALPRCWCSELTIPTELATELAATYTRCLCRDCLRALAAATLDRE